jgi:hypothetical protein
VVGVFPAPFAAIFGGMVQFLAGMWAFTLAGAWAATADNTSSFLTLGSLGPGTTIQTIAMLTGSRGVLEAAAGYLWIVSALLAFYTATALMLAESFGRFVLNVGKAGRPARDITAGIGGVRAGSQSGTAAQIGKRSPGAAPRGAVARCRPPADKQCDNVTRLWTISRYSCGIR